MLFTQSLLVLVAAASSASALPGFFDKRAPAAPPAPSATYCNIAGAQMPIAPTPLAWPSIGLTLQQVAIGRGTQNYTCANSTAQAIPVQVGANATLFNATCLAAPFPQLLALLPNISLEFPVPQATGPESAATVYLSGHHYFQDATTPFFNLDTTEHSWGTVACRKINATAAPNPATDVPWLKLQSKNSDGCTISEVYRVNTAGGAPPKTCEGQPANIYVQYAAEYWFWGGGSTYSALPPSPPS